MYVPVLIILQSIRLEIINLDKIDWHHIARMMKGQGWTAAECQKIWKFVAYSQEIDHSDRSTRNTTVLQSDTDDETLDPSENKSKHYDPTRKFYCSIPSTADMSENNVTMANKRQKQRVSLHYIAKRMIPIQRYTSAQPYDHKARQKLREKLGMNKPSPYQTTNGAMQAAIQLHRNRRPNVPVPCQSPMDFYRQLNSSVDWHELKDLKLKNQMETKAALDKKRYVIESTTFKQWQMEMDRLMEIKNKAKPTYVEPSNWITSSSGIKVPIPPE